MQKSIKQKKFQLGLDHDKFDTPVSQESKRMKNRARTQYKIFLLKLDHEKFDTSISQGVKKHAKSDHFPCEFIVKIRHAALAIQAATKSTKFEKQPHPDSNRRPLII